MRIGEPGEKETPIYVEPLPEERPQPVPDREPAQPVKREQPVAP